jgi:hypothetical protein
MKLLADIGLSRRLPRVCIESTQTRSSLRSFHPRRCVWSATYHRACSNSPRRPCAHLLPTIGVPRFLEHCPYISNTKFSTLCCFVVVRKACRRCGLSGHSANECVQGETYTAIGLRVLGREVVSVVDEYLRLDIFHNTPST